MFNLSQANEIIFPKNSGVHKEYNNYLIVVEFVDSIAPHFRYVQSISMKGAQSASAKLIRVIHSINTPELENRPWKRTKTKLVRILNTKTGDYSIKEGDFWDSRLKWKYCNKANKEISYKELKLNN